MPPGRSLVEPPAPNCHSFQTVPPGTTKSNSVLILCVRSIFWPSKISLWVSYQISFFGSKVISPINENDSNGVTFSTLLAYGWDA